jgi:hypothetical protein
MQSFSDFLPQESKEQLSENNFKVGAVLKYHVDFTKPPKVKRLIVVGVDAEKVLFAAVLINSKINPKVFPSPELQNLHVELDSIGREYLDHKSFVDCSNLIEQDIATIKNLMATLPITHLGSLSEQDLKDVTDKIKGAKTVTPKMKKKYGFL